MINHGSFVISLDFEMMWGCHDWTTPEEYGESNIKYVPEIINRMLNLFKQYGVHATFATVGLIMCEGLDDVLKYSPNVKPSYLDDNYSPYKDSYIKDISKEDSLLYYAPDLVHTLSTTDGIEIGSHTFSHFFCEEKGQTLEQFRADISSMISISEKYNVQIHSIVFPKNQIVKDYLSVCNSYGITSYRGVAIKYFDETKSKWGHLKNRICRLLDAYINIGGMSGVPYSEICIDQDVINLRSSRMLRPFSKTLSFLDGMRLRRIKREMIDAAKNNKMYHIWWHPHNFGTNIDENLVFLDKVLSCYKQCHEKYGMQSYNMHEMRNELIESK